MQIYNTLTRQKEEFIPLDPAHVTMYVCGPTVYSYTHIGNARPVAVFDVLYRLLKTKYPRVTYVRNITDIDDRIMDRAAEQGVPFTDITEKFTRVYQEDAAALGALDPDVQPKVTETIPEIIAMIETLISLDKAYEAEGHVLFQVGTYDGYGELSKRDPEEMLAGARVEVAPYKKDPGDFVLWKPSSEDQPGWDSPWGRGRPGWHIECSAMAEKHLGETIDIHGGGIDLAFPHHENERAQSTCAHGGKVFARYWMHNGFLNVDSEKMSKSIGNVLLPHDLLKDHPGETLRLVLLSGHYRQPIDWTDGLVAQSQSTLDGWYQALRDVQGIEAADIGAPEAFVAALEDDLNTPKAIAEVSDTVRKLNVATEAGEQAQLKGQLLAAGGLLGVLGQEPESWFKDMPGSGDVDAAQIEALIADRAAARKAKDFAKADEIRDQLTDMGVQLDDGPEGTTWKVIR